MPAGPCQGGAAAPVSVSPCKCIERLASQGTAAPPFSAHLIHLYDDIINHLVIAATGGTKKRRSLAFSSLSLSTRSSTVETMVSR
jgi:hypothetical protein